MHWRMPWLHRGLRLQSCIARPIDRLTHRPTIPTVRPTCRSSKRPSDRPSDHILSIRPRRTLSVQSTGGIIGPKETPSSMLFTSCFCLVGVPLFGVCIGTVAGLLSEAEVARKLSEKLSAKVTSAEFEFVAMMGKVRPRPSVSAPAPSVSCSPPRFLLTVSDHTRARSAVGLSPPESGQTSGRRNRHATCAATCTPPHGVAGRRQDRSARVPHHVFANNNNDDDDRTTARSTGTSSSSCPCCGSAPSTPTCSR